MCACCSVAQLCSTLCNPMDCSMPGFPVHHYLPEFIQTHVHRVSDAIQPSHPLSSPFPPAFNLSQQQGLFTWVSSSHQVARVLELQLQLLVLPMNIQDWFPLGWTSLIFVPYVLDLGYILKYKFWYVSSGVYRYKTNFKFWNLDFRTLNYQSLKLCHYDNTCTSEKTEPVWADTVKVTQAVNGEGPMQAQASHLTEQWPWSAPRCWGLQWARILVYLTRPHCKIENQASSFSKMFIQDLLTCF